MLIILAVISISFDNNNKPCYPIRTVLLRDCLYGVAGSQTKFVQLPDKSNYMGLSGYHKLIEKSFL